MDPVTIPITNELDLHTFHPRDAASIVNEYILACREKGIFTLRIIHGKGKGHLRRTVHSALSRNTLVESFSLAPAQSGGWGATIAILKDKPHAP